ncbi:adenosylmethionine decarboxylase [Candidatus Bathyarchaeota archaeon]|nr:MAG: adenosylmethionine decarboxylase [Candidatus Bathyarchaeota archaeon]
MTLKKLTLVGEVGMETRYLGKHLIAEFYGCSRDKIDNPEFLREILENSILKAGGHIVGRLFHRFNPQGVTGIVAISESHVSVHTWPENGYMALDIFTCGSEMDPWVAYREIFEKIKPGKVKVIEINRGELKEVKAEA